MKSTVLIDNTPSDGLAGEHGLSFLIEHGGKKILLDTGATGAFVSNAKRLGCELSDVDFCVLSHAHYDHSDGLSAFFAENSGAKLYLREGSAENAYRRIGCFFKYIGIKRGTLKKYADRIEFVSGKRELSPGVWLVPHNTKGLEAVGRNAKMYRRHGLLMKPDDFSHEQSLVVETEEGLVIFNSCSHGGADNIIREISEAFDGSEIYAIVGGFHLFRSGVEEISAFAEKVDATGISHAVTGHCTGEAYSVLKERLGDRVERFYSGYTMTVGE
ncbi:MAG: MBL fold metallo-hydrolase [Clostridia bacterium]|nr:MBL fold metallo-hydrolase [Clostridia bacterium]